MSQKLRNKKKREARSRPIRHAKNPGVSSLLLVNPANPAPVPAKGAVSENALAKAVDSAVNAVLKHQGRSMPKSKEPRVARPPKRPKRRPRRRPASPSALPVQAQVVVSRPSAVTRSARLQPVVRRGAHVIPLDLEKRYRGFKARKTPYRGKIADRGLKTLEHARRSILWELSKGSPAAQQWVLENVPKVNPSGGLSIGLGVGSFLGSRIAANLSSHVPVLNRLGPHAPVIASAAVAGLTYFFTRKRPGLKEPLLYGAGLALLDAILKNYVPAYLPRAAGVLGNPEPYPLLEYEPTGYLPAYDPTGGMGWDVEPAMASPLGFDVHEAMADSEDGMGFDVHEAMAGVGCADDGTGAYVPVDGTGAYVPDSGTGTYVPSNESMGSYYPTSGLGESTGEKMQDAAAMMFGGPMALAQLRAKRAWQHRRRPVRGRVMHPPPGSHLPNAPVMVHAPPGGTAMRGGYGRPYQTVNVYCPPYARRHPGQVHALHPAAVHPEALHLVHPAMPPVLMPHPAALTPHVLAAPIKMAPQVTKAAKALSGSPGGIFAND